MAHDIRHYHKLQDNLQMGSPEPKSSHFQRPEERFDRDFATHDLLVRQQEKARKQEILQSRRQ